MILTKSKAKTIGEFLLGTLYLKSHTALLNLMYSRFQDVDVSYCLQYIQKYAPYVFIRFDFPHQPGCSNPRQLSVAMFPDSGGVQVRLGLRRFIITNDPVERLSRLIDVCLFFESKSYWYSDKSDKTTHFLDRYMKGKITLEEFKRGVELVLAVTPEEAPF